ncbi:MAG TPA: tetratricopeptide repeat protein [Casimicrobiaceae bacterium]|nr:tetratricopeptide repeat protein [Casimicrobiaceae bacterium]
MLADAQSNYAEAAAMLEKCIALRRALESPVDLAAALSTASMVRLHIGEADSARELEAEAVRIFREIRNPIGEAIGLLHLGQIDAYVGKDADAKTNFEKCLTMASDVEYFEVESECQLMLGQLALESGDWAGARDHFSQGLEVSRQAEDKRNEAAALWWLGVVDLRSGDSSAAQQKLSGALRVFVASDMFSELVGCLEDHASLLKAFDRPEDAARLCGAVETTRERLALPRIPRSALRWKSLVADIRGMTGPEQFERASREGADLELQEVVSFVLSQRAPELATA